MGINYPAYKVKRRYIFLENFDENLYKKFIKRYIFYFGYIDFLIANFYYLKLDKYFVISLNRKRLRRAIFILYTIGINDFDIFRTIKEGKKYKGLL